jgi:hypothetical protein
VSAESESIKPELENIKEKFAKFVAAAEDGRVGALVWGYTTVSGEDVKSGHHHVSAQLVGRGGGIVSILEELVADDPAIAAALFAELFKRVAAGK